MTELRPVTQENLESVLGLRVEDGQKGFVSTTAESLAQAYVYSETAYPFAVYNGPEIVGFIMMGYYREKAYYTLWKLLIDRKYQRRGYGRKALELGIAFLKERFGVTEIYTGVSPGNTAAKSLYLSMGFRETGLTENNMEELCLKCRSEDIQAGRSGNMQQNDTLTWYRENAETFLTRTGNVDMTMTYDPFLELVAPGGSILDLGCGAGSAALYFTRKGYRVLAVDGCAEYCEHTRRRAGCEVRQMLFGELDYTDVFDGIWACASLLHVGKDALPGVLRLIRRALKEDGVFYASFKYGETERKKNGRLFSDFTEESLRALLEEAGGFRVEKLWTTADARPERAEERWVNVLCFAK